MTARDQFYVGDKDPNYVYRFLNTAERNMIGKKWDGWEIVTGPPENPVSVVGQSTETPSGGVTRQRGDLILARMPVAEFDKKIAGPRQQARERQQHQLDTMVDDSNERARSAARSAGISNIPRQMVFREDPKDPLRIDE